MDTLAELLDGARARGALFQQSVLTPPWGLRFEDRAPLSLLATVRGGAWLRGDGPGEAAGPPVELRPGALAVVRGPEPYLVADAPDGPPRVVVHAGDRCTTVDGRDLAESLALGPRTWGDDPQAPTVLLSGQYQVDSMVSRRLLTALPRMLLLPPDAASGPLTALASAELRRDVPGQQVVLDRLLDVLLSGALRSWFARPEAGAPAWFRAHRDPVAGGALRLMHREPQRRWSIAGLAEAVGVSRATLSRRFTEQVGEPPMTYLTTWRLTLAADLLREPETTVESAARQVGYASGFALSTAFKRMYGVSPRDFRTGPRQEAALPNAAATGPTSGP